MTQFKEKSARAQEFGQPACSTYPVLQAADILLYDTDEVPVGDDQRQHVELTRDLAIRFNHRFGDDLRGARSRRSRAAGAASWTCSTRRARCRSRPSRRRAPCSCSTTAGAITKKIKSRGHRLRQRGALRPAEPSPASRTCSTILAAATDRTVESVAAEYAGTGYGALKGAVADAVVELLTPVRERYADLANDPGEVDRILGAGAPRGSRDRRPGADPSTQRRRPAPARELMSAHHAEPAPDEPVTRPQTRYRRHNPGLEFDRVAFFSDAVFVIAMTLLVVGIGVPSVAESGLPDALKDKQPEILSFFVSFVVVGNYWLAHHRFVAHLAAVTPRLMTINLIYLAAIAFAPFPTALAGKYTERPVAIVLYAITLSVASTLEAVMFVFARRNRLLTVEVPDDVLRYSVVAAMIPVLLFVVSIPIAYVDTKLALMSWILIFPFEWAADRWMKPVGADQILGG